MSVLFCDSNCELWYKEQEKLGIKYISMPYTIEGKEFYYDLGKNTDFFAFYDKVRKGAIPKTSALNVNDYIEYFEPVLQKGDDIFYITFSHKLSATFEQMDIAINELKAKYPKQKITIFDSCNISMGAGIQVYRAAVLHNKGMSDENLLTELESIRAQTKVLFIVDDLVYLKRGGRLSNAKAILGSFLNLKPILSVTVDGKLESIAKIKGRKKAIETIINQMIADGINTEFPIVILDADCFEYAEILSDKLKNALGNNINIWRQPIGPVIGSHCGPDTLGLIYCKKTIK